MIGVDGTAITVESDDPSLLDRLEPWRIELDTALVDYRIEFDPPKKGASRPLPRIKHGSCDLVRLRDRDLLEITLLRILNAFGSVTEPNQVRLALMPLEFDGHVLLVPPMHAGKLSHRWYVDRRITPWYSATAVVDVDDRRAGIGQPLGSDEAPVWYPVCGWWLPTLDPTAPLSPGEAVAHTMSLAARAALPVEHAERTLNTVAELVRRFPPSLAPVVADSVVELIDREGAAELAASFGEAVEACFGLR